MRETLFNWLGQDLSGKSCLDLFAGSGALGFEAASRNADVVVMVEHDRAICEGLKRNVSLLACEGVVRVHCADALEFARTTVETFDVVFVDPPFDSGLIPTIMSAIPRVLRRGAAVYVESAKPVALVAPWLLHRRSTAGHVTFQLFIHGDQ